MKSMMIRVGALLTIASLAACSSSSTSSPDGSASASDDSAAAACSAYPLVACSQGKTCCLGATGITGTCTDPTQCNSNFQFECVSASNCATSQVCCATTELPSGFDASAFLDASLDAIAIDAAALSGTSNKYFCQATCTGTQVQLCAVSGECKGPGAACMPIAGTSGLLSACAAAGDGGAD
jgi:hypothetical protein